jgi:hypothetical protein
MKQFSKTSEEISQLLISRQFSLKFKVWFIMLLLKGSGRIFRQLAWTVGPLNVQLAVTLLATICHDPVL